MSTKSLVDYSDSPPTYQVLTLTSKDLDTKTTDGSIDSLKYLHQVQKNAYPTEEAKIRYVSGFLKKGAMLRWIDAYRLRQNLEWTDFDGRNQEGNKF